MNNLIPLIQEEALSAERRERLLPLVDYLRQKSSENAPIQLNFICTHNSRRSQFAQFWSAVWANHFGIAVNSFSGGTEATAVYSDVLNSLERFGFKVNRSSGSNPKHMVHLSNSNSIELFSKVFDDPSNPTQDFAAVMTCADADENCPFIPGCEARIALNYSDPKAFDNTPIQSSMYDARSWQIATELYHVYQTLQNEHHVG